MSFISSRFSRSFELCTLKGLADDGGLYLPQTFPKLNLQNLLTLNFQEVFFEIISKFASSEIPEKDLKNLIQKSFSTFRTKDVVELVQVGDFHLLELFHGPTYAFKDVALQFLGNLFEYFLTRREKEGKSEAQTTIIGATSGDTGSAAIYGLRGKKNVQIFVLHPYGRVSPIQERQMTTVLDANVHNLAVKGTFDDCQAIVKGLFNDLNFKKEFSLGAVNSINLVRILSQVSYYFYSYILYLRKTYPTIPENFQFPLVNFSVPTGNSGDILAGFYAKLMGLPVNKLFLCTNKNNTLHNFFKTGEYVRSPEVHKTLSPSMDIQVSSNIERYLYHVAGGDSKLLREWMETFEKTGRLKLPEKYMKIAREHIISSDVTEDETLNMIRELIQKHNINVCPHTAVGIKGAKKILDDNNPIFKEQPLICLATAHPAKFMDAVVGTMEKNKMGSIKYPLPAEFNDLFQKETKVEIVDGNVESVKKIIIKNSVLKSKL